MKLEIKNLTKQYGKQIALNNLSITFEPGIYGILGANGAEKSTMMNLLTDNLKRDGGEILWDGTDDVLGTWSGLQRLNLLADTSTTPLKSANRRKDSSSARACSTGASSAKYLFSIRVPLNNSIHAL